MDLKTTKLQSHTACQQIAFDPWILTTVYFDKLASTMILQPCNCRFLSPDPSLLCLIVPPPIKSYIC